MISTVIALCFVIVILCRFLYSSHLVSSLRLFPWFALLTPASSHFSPSPSLATHLQPPPGSFSVKAHFLFKLLLTLSCLL